MEPSSRLPGEPTASEELLPLTWESWFGLFILYKERFGHTRIPRNHVTENGFKLRAWVRYQRQKHEWGEMTPEQQHALERLPGWQWTSSQGRSHDVAKWDEGLMCVRQYAKLYGHARVPEKYITDNGMRLGTWVAAQRQRYGNGTMSEAERVMLEQVPGWEWSVFLDRWEQHSELLREYVRQHGHSRVPRRYVMDGGFKLGLWVMFQRQKYRQKKLSKDRIQALEMFPGWRWNIRKVRSHIENSRTEHRA